jgi:hypothetical protein
MSMLIIELLEMINVEHDHGKELSAFLISLQIVPDPFFESLAVV